MNWFLQILHMFCLLLFPLCNCWIFWQAGVLLNGTSIHSTQWIRKFQTCLIKNIWELSWTCKYDRYMILIRHCVSKYRTCAIITRSLYIIYPLFGSQKRFFQGGFFRKFSPYVWLVFKSGFWSSTRVQYFDYLVLRVSQLTKKHIGVYCR
jgi:hypothetical protein